LPRRVLSICLKIVISSGLIFWLFKQKEMSLNGIYYQLRHANLAWIFGGLFFFSTSTLLGAIQWRMLMQARNISLSFRLAISYYYVGLFFNNFLPGYIAGDAFRIYDLTKSSGNNPDAVSTVLLDRLIGFVVLTTLALLASLLWMSFREFSRELVYAIFLIFVGWMLALFFLFNANLARKLHRLIKRVLNSRIENKMRAVYLSINSFKHHQRILIKTLVISFALQSLRVITHYAAARAVGVNDIHLFYFFVFIPIVALAVTIPISIGGFGVREQSAVYLFGLPGIGGFASQITSMEFMAYLFGIVSSLPGGFIFIIRKKHRSVIAEKQSLSGASELHQLKEASCR